MNWFKDLFIRKDSQAESIPTSFQRKPDISEPVISFVQTFKVNPKRFRVVNLQRIASPSRTMDNYRLEDKYKKLSWDFSIVVNYGFHGMPVEILEDYPEFLTEQEVEYIYKTMSPWFNSRKILLKMRQDSKQREALKKMYCK